MPASPFTIKSFEIKTGTDQEYALLSEFANQLRAERQRWKNASKAGAIFRLLWM
jgi:hypothetical protein